MFSFSTSTNIFENFDPRAWSEDGGVTRHVAVRSIASEIVRRAGSYVAILTIAAAAAVPFVSVASTPEMVTNTSYQAVRDTGNEGGVESTVLSTRTAVTAPAARSENLISTGEPFEFAKAGSVVMSSEVRSLAGRVLAARSSRTQESGADWASRFLQNVHGD